MAKKKIRRFRTNTNPGSRLKGATTFPIPTSRWLSPKKFGGLANTKQEPWKVSLPAFIEEPYFKRFKTSRPENIRSIEQIVSALKRKKAERKARKQAAVPRKAS